MLDDGSQAQRSPSSTLYASSLYLGVSPLGGLGLPAKNAMVGEICVQRVSQPGHELTKQTTIAGHDNTFALGQFESLHVHVVFNTAHGVCHILKQRLTLTNKQEFQVINTILCEIQGRLSKTAPHCRSHFKQREQSAKH
eukprot:3561399-Amphidinium_carterae.3